MSDLGFLSNIPDGFRARVGSEPSPEGRGGGVLVFPLGAPPPIIPIEAEAFTGAALARNGDGSHDLLVFGDGRCLRISRYDAEQLQRQLDLLLCPVFSRTSDAPTPCHGAPICPASDNLGAGDMLPGTPAPVSFEAAE
ncbi:hypothetical protein [Sphingomonas sp. LaA6.9]|uniref:hypothetical protein n=1 Tax=Sphingomonas sp. LaA6.9 TaxID=2919914 RepID=UPI001F4FD789|nr:hypothetical protein [Sphingomonas sp. LaA6.9]MCJ8158839.1 hypothetical protein [Sphingomonas sp. LaA6.9]